MKRTRVWPILIVLARFDPRISDLVNGSAIVMDGISYSRNGEQLAVSAHGDALKGMYTGSEICSFWPCIDGEWGRISGLR
jgi:hypothetical protein